MRLTWKKDARETGLRSIGAAPQGYKLHDGTHIYATVSPLGGSWMGPLLGWYWVAGCDAPIPHKNTCKSPCETIEEAKKQAKEYVLLHMKGKP